VNIPWTEEEDEILRKIWTSNAPLPACLGQLPGRSYMAARGRANRIGLAGTAPHGKNRGKRASHVEAAIRERLAAGRPLTMEQLADKTGASLSQIAKVLADGHRKTYYVAGWIRVRSHGEWCRRWAIGRHEDVERPRPKRAVEVARAYRIRQEIKQDNSPFAALIKQVTA
jgi:hypothetical protein